MSSSTSGSRGWTATKWRAACALARTAPNLVLVALTGWAGKDVRSKAAEAGFDYHLVKPVNWEELERIVESAVRQST